MKPSARRTALCMVLCLLLSLPAFAAGEQIVQKAAFAGMLDRIAFTLPAGGCTIIESDYPGMFEDVRQIYGNSADGEFTLRTADISGWVAATLELYPEEDPFDIRANTLIRFASMIISSYGGQPTDMGAYDGGEYVRMTFHYTYPDTPGVDYEGAAVLNVETGRAVTLYGECGPINSAAVASLLFVDEEEAAAFAASRAPQTLFLGELTVTFPVQTAGQKTDNSRLTACLTGDFDYLAVQFFPNMRIAVSDDDAQAKADLLKAAQRVILPSIGSPSITQAVLTRPVPGVAVLTIVCPDPYFGITNYRCALCCGRENIYYVWSTDTEAGRAFLDSFVWHGAGQ